MARVLVIEDHAEYRSMVAGYLAEHSHAVCSAENGIDGIAAFKAAPFDLVITDVFMPFADGLEVIKALRAIDEGVPVIAMSGGGHSFPAAVSLAAARALGATAVLYKPFRLDELRDVMGAALSAS